MSAVQTGISNSQFPPFVDTDQHKLHPRQPDLQRPMNPPHLGGSISAQGTMLNLYGAPSQQQQQQQQQQQPQFQHQIPHHQQPQPNQGPHPSLGIMSASQGLVANSGGQPAMQQQIQHQSQLQHSQQQHQQQQQRVLIQQQQRGLAPNSGIMGNPAVQMQQGMFPPTVGQPVRRISAQPQPHPQGATQVNMGLQPPSQNQPMIPQSIVGQLRQGGPNARMLANHGPPQHHDMAHVIAVGRQQQPQQSQQSQPQPQSMVNGMQPGQLSRSASGQLVGGPPHQIPHQQQLQQQPPQHRTPFQQQGPLPSHAASPARPSSHHSQSATATANPMITGASVQQPTIRTQQHTSPDNMFMNLQQQQPQNIFPVPNTQHPPPQPQRPPTGTAGTFPFLPESSGESVNQHPSGAPNPAAPPQTRQPQQHQQPTSFHITPAQTLQQQLQQQQGGQEAFAHVMMSHNPNPNPHHPHRITPSQNATAPPLSVPGSSRPDPAPQAGPSRTPRPPSRHPNQPPPPVRGPPTTQGPQAILPAASPHHRRPSAGIPVQTTASAPPQHDGPPAPPPMLRQPMPYGSNVVGSGQGLLRLLSFSAAMANEKCDRLKRDHWSKIVSEYFQPQASWKLLLCKDAERRDTMLFEISTNVLAVFLLVACQSGVRSMNFVLDGARERSICFGTSVIECPDAQWIWRYYDGHVVVLRGAFSCQITAFFNSKAESDQVPYTLKIDSMNFDATLREKMIMLDAIQGTRGVENVQKTPSTTTQGSPDNASPPSNTAKDDAERLSDADPRILIDHALLPADPIGLFGIPQAAMRCLELAESLGQMTDVIQYGHAQRLGPDDAFRKLSGILKHQMGPERVPPIFQSESNKSVSLFGNNFPFGNHLAFGNNLAPTSDQPPHAQHMPPTQSVPPPGPIGPPQAVPMPSPQHQHQLQHQPQQQSQPPPSAPKSGPSTGVAAPSGPSLKRKAQPDGPVGSGGGGGQADLQQPPAKRVTRRKSKAGGG